MKKIIVLAALCFCALGTLAAADAPNGMFTRTPIVTAKMYGMGGPHAAAVIGFDTLFSNPAALSRAGKRGMVTGFDMQVAGPLNDLAKMAFAGDFSSDRFADSLLSLVARNNGLRMSVDALGPIAFGFINNGFGLGIFNRTLVSTDFPSVTKVKAAAGEELQLILGWGFDLIKLDFLRISAGASFNGFAQMQVAYSGSPMNLFNSAASLSMPVWLTLGFGLDAGVLVSFGKVVHIGVMYKDMYAPSYTGVIGNVAVNNGSITTSWQAPQFGAPAFLRNNLSAGISLNFVEKEKGFITSWKVMADYRDALAMFQQKIYRNPILNISAGTELVLFNMISLRAGIYDTYFCAGAGLGFGPFKLDVALYTQELGLEPGDSPLMNLKVSMGFNY